jgi:hypothetical protein
MRNHFRSISILTLAIVLGACGQNTPTSQTTKATTAVVKTTPTLLTKLELDAGRTIEFLEIEPGDVVIVETSNMDRQRPILSGGFANGKTLPELYQALAPANSRVPQALEEAQARRVSMPDDSTEGVDQSLPGETQEAGSLPLMPQTKSVNRGVRSSVDWDWNADATWFLSYFCKTNFSHFCSTNTGSAWSWKYKSVDYTYFEASGMNASFESGAFMYSDYYKCVGFSCSWRRTWDSSIAPRYIKTFVGTKVRPRYARIDGYGPYPRVHFAVMRVEKGKPNPPSLSVSALGNRKFSVSGSGYKANTAVYVHIGYGNFTNEALHTVMSNSAGQINATLYQPCNQDWQMNFVANDGRLNPDTGSDLYSNNAYATCQ